MVQVVLSLDESIQHIHKDCPLRLSCACAGLPIVGVVNAKPVLERRVDVILENARQINRVFFEIIKRPDRIEEGAVIHLSTPAKCAQGRYVVQWSIPALAP